jgi:hypothetical protein
MEQARGPNMRTGEEFSFQRRPQENLLTNLRFSHVGFEVLTPVVMKSYIFRDITPCSQLKVTDISEEHIASIFMVEE